MGGSVAFMLRDRDGEEHRMCRWTNTMPYFVKNVRLVRKNRPHLAKWVKTWTDMYEDYTSGANKHNMSKVYASHPYLAPYSYGLVVVDCIKNKIISCQDYTSFDTFFSISCKVDMDQEGEESFYKYNRERGPNQAFLLREFFMLDKILRVERWNNKKEEYEVWDTFKEEVGSAEDLLRCLKDRKMTDSLNFYLNLHPFELVDLGRPTKDNLGELKKQVLDLGFKLSKKEEKLWDDFLKDEEE
jgi:hypothetical protein